MVAEEVATVNPPAALSHEISVGHPPTSFDPSQLRQSRPTGDGSFEKLLLAQISRNHSQTKENLILEASL